MEAIILYLVLFFPGAGTASFASEMGELGRIFIYIIPSLALIWFLISDRNGLSALKKEKPKKEDLLPFSISFPGLILISLGISFLAGIISGYVETAPPPLIQSPENIPGWLLLFISCLGTGYLEESYFRFYLLTKLENQIPGKARRVIFSTLLFSICHVYAGHWSVFNAALAGIFLSVIFLRFRSLHAIALAHGLYNFVVYVGSGWWMVDGGW